MAISTRIYQDRVVVFSVLDFGYEPGIRTLQYWERLKARLKTRFNQLDVLITIQELLAV
jgi:hypothetical protein